MAGGPGEVGVSLFPRCLFCCFHLSRRLPVITTPGVVQIVRCPSYPCKLRRKCISPLCNALANSRSPTFLARRRQSSYHEGSVGWHRGIVEIEKGARRIVVSIDLVQRSVLLEIAADRISALSLCSRSFSRRFAAGGPVKVTHPTSSAISRPPPRLSLWYRGAGSLNSPLRRSCKTSSPSLINYPTWTPFAIDAHPVTARH